MTLTKEQKKNLIDELSEKISSSKAVVFTNYQGLKVQDINELRKKLKQKGIYYKVVKNTLLKKVMRDKGIKFEESLLDNPAALAFGLSDEIEANKVVYEYAKSNEKLGILGALVGREFVDKDTVKSLALLPSREELYAKVVGSISAPISGFVKVMAGNLRGLVSVLKQYSEKVK